MEAKDLELLKSKLYRPVEPVEQDGRDVVEIAASSFSPVRRQRYALIDVKRELEKDFEEKHASLSKRLGNEVIDAEAESILPAAKVTKVMSHDDYHLCKKHEGLKKQLQGQVIDVDQEEEIASVMAEGDLPDIDAPLAPFDFEDLVGLEDQQEDVFGLGHSLDHP